MLRALKKNAYKLPNISADRIQDELNKMLLTKYPDKAIKLLQIVGLSKYIFPELDKLIGLKQNKYHKDDAMRHTLEVLKNSPPDIITRLASLFHDIGKYKTMEVIDGEVHFYRHEEIGAHIAKDILKRLKYPKYIQNSVFIMIDNHMRTKQAGDDAKNMSDKAVRKLKQDLGDNLDKTLDLIQSDNMSHSEASSMPNQVKNIKRRLKEVEEKDKKAPKKSPLDGDDIQNILGIGKGPMVGKILTKLGDMYLEDPTLTKEELSEVVKKLYDEYI
jgi:putative nucleotidyltransferase with HDIG domain